MLVWAVGDGVWGTPVGHWHGEVGCGSQKVGLGVVGWWSQAHGVGFGDLVVSWVLDSVGAFPFGMFWDCFGEGGSSGMLAGGG